MKKLNVTSSSLLNVSYFRDELLLTPEASKEA